MRSTAVWPAVLRKGDRCLRDTRVEVLEQITEWAVDPESKPVFWLCGKAGMGKSTISRSICDMLGKEGKDGLQNLLGASFFFQRGQGEAEHSGLFCTTLAAQLALTTRKNMAPSISQAIKDQVDILEKNRTMKDQFDKLILQPLQDLHVPEQSIPTTIILVDALDECEEEEAVGWILGLFTSEDVRHNTRLKLFVTGRPQYHVQKAFQKISDCLLKCNLDKGLEGHTEKDIRLFFHDELRKIKESYNEEPLCRRLPDDWPGAGRMDELVTNANRLFIFAKTMSRYIEDRYLGPPDRNLQFILECQTAFQGRRMNATYEPVLQRLQRYETGEGLVRRPPKEVDMIAQKFRNIVGPIVLLREPLSTTSLASLGLEKDIKITESPLAFLHSVLNIPTSQDAPIEPFHLSFREFLVSPDNRPQPLTPNPFWIDERETHRRISRKCLWLLGKRLKLDICGLGRHGTLRSGVKPQRINQALPAEIQYACLYWVYHTEQANKIEQAKDGNEGSDTDQESDTKQASDTEQAKKRRQDLDQAYNFLEAHFLHWLEALSLIGRISESIGFIDELQSLVHVSHYQSHTPVFAKILFSSIMVPKPRGFFTMRSVLS